uniref:STAS domain-containing protein n=1 Tax=Candidatus Electronema sp. TaxID=2698783 RepID=UPI0040577BC1
MEMNITVKQAGKAAVAAVSGYVDGKTAPNFQAQMLDLVRQSEALLIDFAELSFISSAGMRAMLLIQQESRQGERNTPLVLAAMQDQVKDILAATGFLPLFTVCCSVEEGLQELGAIYEQN